MLPFNVKHCTSQGDRDGAKLSIFVGRKNDTPLASAYRLDFDYRVVSRADDYLQIVLTCGNGPLGTRDYRIVLELTPIEGNRTFLHLAYAYGYGTMSKVAMQAYLSTLGASKVGFTMEGEDLVHGMRGVMERNTMRYYLAVEAYLASVGTPQDARTSKRLNDWFSAQSRYPRQLGEDVSRAEYLAMKQKEYARVASARLADGS
nr:NAD/FAD-utilizing enzyme apparently involved in cell division [uncultured bacterium]